MNIQPQHYKAELILKLSKFKYGVKALQLYGQLKYRLRSTSIDSVLPRFGDSAPASKHQLATYSPQTRLHDSLWTILKYFFLEIQRTRWQIWVTFKRDFVSAYNQTALGFLWSLVLPLIPVTVYLLLAYIRVLKTAENMPFVVYIVIGMTLWMFLSGTILSSITAIQKGKTVLETSKYPLLAVILSSFGQMVFDTSVRIGFVIVVLIFFKISLSWGILLLPIALLPLTLFSLGLGMILAVLNVIIKDVGNMADVVMRYGVFLSSVIFPMPETDLLGRLNLLNPFNTFVVAIRDLIVFGTMAHPGRYLVTSAAAVIIFLVACKIVYFMEYRIKGYL